VTANLHRSLSAKQREWPLSVREGDGLDPLLVVAALLYSVADFGAYLDRYARQLADWIVALAHELARRLGDDWRQSLGLGPLWGTP
jgi:hypothetical protein